MGNCQASDAATVVIVHPGKKVERMFRSVIAREIMDSNPGHYVALVVTSVVVKSVNGSPVKQLKLLRPDDNLLIGQVYRLISIEDVLKEFAAKKCLKLGKLMNERGLLRLEKKKDVPGAPSTTPIPPSIKRVHNSRAGGGWKPGLKTISEMEN